MSAAADAPPLVNAPDAQPDAQPDVQMQDATKPKRYKRAGDPAGSPAKKAKSARATGMARGRDPVRQRAADKPPKTAEEVSRMENAAEKHVWNCFYGVLRLLMFMVERKSLPALPSPAVMKEWSGDLSDVLAEDVVMSLPEENRLANEQLIRKVDIVKAAAAFTGCRTTKFIARVPNADLEALFYSLGKIGLPSFAPDILPNNPDSDWNLAHEQFAIKAFQRLASVYVFGAPVASSPLIRNRLLLVEKYRNYVFKNVRNRLTVDTNRPGVFAMHVDTGDIYARRRRLCASRVKYARANAWPSWFREVIEREDVHSDDERDEDGKHWIVRKKEGRNPLLTMVLHEADRMIANYNLRHKRTRIYEDEPPERQHHKDPKPSVFTSVPIDLSAVYFEPRFFNTFTLAERGQYREYGACLPAADDAAITMKNPAGGDAIVDVEKLIKFLSEVSDEDFKEKHAPAALKPYNFPTDRQMEQLLDAGMLVPDDE